MIWWPQFSRQISLEPTSSPVKPKLVLSISVSGMRAELVLRLAATRMEDSAEKGSNQSEYTQVKQVRAKNEWTTFPN